MKTVSQIQSVSDIRGMHSIGGRSIPKAQRSHYLELYVLDRERDRLEKERYATDKRRNNVQKRLNNLFQRMEQIQREISQETEGKVGRVASSRKPLKTMAIKY